MDITDAGDTAIGEVARLTGLTTRTLRYWASVGLLTPSRTGPGGVRCYDGAALVRLQRILLLRELGLPLAAVARALATSHDEVAALREHLAQLVERQHRLARQSAAVRATITTLTEGTTMTPEQIFDGFDHTAHREEVEQRWGAEGYAASDSWWRAMPADRRAAWRAEQTQLAAGWRAGAAAGIDPAGPAGQALAARQVAFVSAIPGTPGTVEAPALGYVVGLGDLYVADPRFAAVYGGPAGAALVRDALRAWAADRG